MWLAHCSVLAAAFAALPAMPVAAQGQAQARAGATVLVVGDSLSAEYGLKRGSGWVALLEQRLAREGIAATVVNASVSGDTTSGGRSRLPALLRQHRPSHVIVELGGNDALRGLPLAMTQDNLTAMARAAKADGAKVLPAGMQVPPNYGRAYTDAFAALFDEVSRSQRVPLVPFFLDGIAEDMSMFQPDRIHPNDKAQPRLLENVWPALETLLG